MRAGTQSAHAVAALPGMNPQTAFKSLAVIVTVWAIPQFRNMQDVVKERQQASQDYPRYSELWPAVPIVLVLILLRYYWNMAVSGVALNLVNSRSRTASRGQQIQARRLTLVSFKAIFFTFSAMFGYLALRKTEWLPPVLGGQGSLAAIFEGYPYQIVSPGVKWYYCLCCAYHANLLWDLLTESPFPDFWEDTLRVSVGFLLIAFSFANNFIRTGSPLLLIHDITDTLTCACKVFVATEYKAVTFTVFLALLTSWAYFRLYCLTTVVLYPLFKAFIHTDWQDEVHGRFWVLFCMFTLLLINIYWFSLMLRMLAHFVMSGKATDMHANLSEPSDEYDSSPSTSGLTPIASPATDDGSGVSNRAEAGGLRQRNR